MTYLVFKLATVDLTTTYSEMTYLVFKLATVDLDTQWEDSSHSVLWYCWLGLLTCKTVSRVTYTVLAGTLNPAQSINQLAVGFCGLTPHPTICQLGFGQQCHLWTLLTRFPLDKAHVVQIGALWMYTVSQKMHQLWNGVAQNYRDRFWWNLEEIFERLE